MTCAFLLVSPTLQDRHECLSYQSLFDSANVNATPALTLVGQTFLFAHSAGQTGMSVLPVDDFDPPIAPKPLLHQHHMPRDRILPRRHTIQIHAAGGQ